MTTETEIIEDEAAPVVVAEAADPPETDTPAADAPSAEDRALTMGWTHLAQFKGDPAKWVDAETFVKRGEEFLPFLKANNKRLEQAIEKANARSEKLEKALQKSVEHISRADQRAYEKARKDLETELDAAATAGDADAVRAVNKELIDLEREVAAPKDDKAAEAEAHTAAIDAFKDANPWFETDDDMTAYARGLTFPADTPLKDQLRQIAEKTKKTFAHKFENPRRQQAPAVESSQGGRRTMGKTYADLPPDAKAMCDDFVRDIKGFTKEKYVKDYFA